MFPLPLARRTNRAVLDTHNLINNGSMEAGSPPTNWLQGAELPALSSVADARTGSTGTKSLDVALAAAQTLGTVYYALSGMEVGKSYRFSGWAKNIDGDTLMITVYDSAWGALVMLNNVNPGNKWTYYSQEFTSNDTTGFVLMQVRGTAAKHARFDDFTLNWISTASIGPDLIMLGNMESGNPPDGWAAGGGTPALAAAADERTGGSGSQSLDITVAAAQTQGAVYNSVSLATTVGATYQLTAWLKNIDLATGIYVVAFDAAYNTLVVSDTHSGTSWLEIQCTFVAATTTSIIYPIAAGTAGQHALIDDISVRILW